MAVREAIDTASALKKAVLLKLDATKLLKIAENAQEQLLKKNTCANENSVEKTLRKWTRNY